MSGQAGSSRASLSYHDSSDTISGGIDFEPSPRLRLGLDLAWNQADSTLDPFDFEVSPSLLNPNQSYDFTNSASNSDLDLSRIEASLEGRYRLRERLWLTGRYRWIDLEDDAPYLSDATGTVSFASIGLAWNLN